MSRDDAIRLQRFRLRAGRMEAFSDGVFAIAITLLVLEIAVPAGSALWRFAVKEDLLRPERDDADVRLLTRWLTPGLAFYMVFIMNGLFFPVVAVVGYLLVAVGLIIPARRRN